MAEKADLAGVTANE
ncbi:hypothetical protein [Escherichia sp. E1S7]|nr:hypothetical protein [Escherichia sp. E1S7]